MAYDFPYRLERNQHVLRDEQPVYQIVNGDGVICTGENFMQMRRIVELVNEAAAIEQGDRGR